LIVWATVIVCVLPWIWVLDKEGDSLEAVLFSTQIEQVEQRKQRQKVVPDQMSKVESMEGMKQEKIQR
jgi:hypothetical protein